MLTALRLVLLAALAGGPAYAQPADSAAGSVHTEDSALGSDSTRAAVLADSVETLPDSAAARLDSAAVAALSDTTARVTGALGESAEVDLLGRRLFQIWGGSAPSVWPNGRPASRGGWPTSRRAGKWTPATSGSSMGTPSRRSRSAR